MYRSLSLALGFHRRVALFVSTGAWVYEIVAGLLGPGAPAWIFWPAKKNHPRTTWRAEQKVRRAVGRAAPRCRELATPPKKSAVGLVEVSLKAGGDCYAAGT